MSVDLHTEDVASVKEINESFLESWYGDVCEREKKTLSDISVILCSDDYLLEMNRQYLDHDYYTDIITFDYSEEDLVSGDLFISIDRVTENANERSIAFDDELHRVCVHGLLHLIGYKDKSESEEALMRAKEDEMLKLRLFHVEHLNS
jgi:probable rRNA maturation factor